MKTADIILSQLGGNKFIACTGCHHFLSDGDSLRMIIPRNASRANRLTVTLDRGLDAYTMRFWRYTPSRLSHKTWAFTEEKIEEVKTFSGVYFDQLQELFTEVTHMYTHL